jgi:ribosome-associated protein YbcJ (S4-like RNA binding protein)
MRFQLLAHRIAVPLLGLALTTTAAACSSSSTSAAGAPSASAAGSSSAAASAPPSSSAPASSSAPSSPAAAGGNAKALITANWEAFFNGKTDAAKKISVLQNGDKFSAIIKAQAGSGLASSAGAKVTAVVVNSATSATVSYNITLGGATALANQTGTAVYEDGTWKVGDISFCQLLKLENNGTAPSVCNG